MKYQAFKSIHSSIVEKFEVWSTPLVALEVEKEGELAVVETSGSSIVEKVEVCSPPLVLLDIEEETKSEVLVSVDTGKSRVEDVFGSRTRTRGRIVCKQRRRNG